MSNYKNQKTFPNQKIITIHKEPVKDNFVQVSIDEWQEAFVRLPARISFGLYLYLCGNKDQFHLALSSVDVQKSLGVSDSSYRRAVDDLLAEGYLIMRNNNEHTLDFYTTPQPTDYVKKERKKKKPATDGGAAAAEPVSMEDTPSEPPADDDEENLSSYLLSQYSSSKYGWS